MKRRGISLLLCMSMIAGVVAGCGGTSETAESKVPETTEKKAVVAKTEPFGDNIVYDPSVEINNGEDITIEFWEWGSDELFQELIDGYTAIHPNVTIELVNNPWDDYWTKLPLVL